MPFSDWKHFYNVDAVFISLESKVPVLFMSNPGFGKTTIMKRFAQNNGMHLGSVIILMI